MQYGFVLPGRQTILMDADGGTPDAYAAGWRHLKRKP